MLVVSKLKADDRVAGKGYAPVRQEKVGGLDLRKIDATIAPAIRVVGFGTIVAVAQIVNGDPISVHFSPGGSIAVGLPIALVRGLQGEPPCEHTTKAGETQDGSPTRSFELE